MSIVAWAISSSTRASLSAIRQTLFPDPGAPVTTTANTA
jgi:hypothetical protein